MNDGHSTHSNSRIKQWFDGGGTLKASWGERKRLKILYPFIDKRVKRDRFDPLAFLFVMVFFAAVGGWCYFFNFAFTSGSERTPSDLELTVIAISENRTSTPAETLEPLPTFTPTIVPSPIPAMPTLPPSAAKPTFSLLSASFDAPYDFADIVIAEPSPVPIEADDVVFRCDDCQQIPVSVRIGWFYPPLGGGSCPNDNDCIDQPLSSGDSWFLVQGRALACPQHFPIKSTVVIESLGVALPCLHRLPLAACDFSSGVCDVLILSASEIIPWGAVYEAVLNY